MRNIIFVRILGLQTFVILLRSYHFASLREHIARAFEYIESILFIGYQATQI